MARLQLVPKIRIMAILVQYMEMLNEMMFLFILITFVIITWRHLHRNRLGRLYYHQLIHASDGACIESTRMDRRTFAILCHNLRTIGGLKGTKNMDVEEMVAIFLRIVSHDVKNRIMRRQFARSGETVSRQFNVVLSALLRLHELLLKKPEPVSEYSTDERWKWFKNCLGAIDGTYIKVNVPTSDKPRYRTKKNQIATNVLGVCSQDMQFIYVLPGWEGSAHNSRVLQDAISRRNGLKVPRGHYYLCDTRYPNNEGFLAPYKGEPYPLNSWTQLPSTPKEFFNMKHSFAQNVTKRAFGLLKRRWKILRGRSHYPVKIQCQVIAACCLLHNLIRREMPMDPLELELSGGGDDDDHDDANDDNEEDDNLGGDCCTHLETPNGWAAWRDDLASEMFEKWLGSQHA